MGILKQQIISDETKINNQSHETGIAGANISTLLLAKAGTKSISRQNSICAKIFS